MVKLHSSGHFLVYLNRGGHAIAKSVEFGCAGIPGGKVGGNNLRHPSWDLVVPCQYMTMGLVLFRRSGISDCLIRPGREAVFS
ncbi:hypothetical protein D3C71_2038420 [compost metagenome]